MSQVAAGSDEIADRARVAAFVSRHFTLRGTLALHRNALGLDLLKAPANVALAPVHFLTRLLALLLSLVGARRVGRWLGQRQLLFPSQVGRVLEGAITRELLMPRQASAPNPRQVRLIAEYTAVRNAVAEITTTGLVLVAGFALFHKATPGILSLAPALSEYSVRSSAIANFPLGRGLGRAWYGMFPVELPVWYVIAVGVALALVASLVTSFAGVLADPIQARLGLHRRRLLRLLRALDAAEDGRPALAREHLVARLADITDIGMSVLRFFRS